MKSLWRMWAKALGTKEGMSDAEADRIAIVRTIIILPTMFTNAVIVAGVLRHW